MRTSRYLLATTRDAPGDAAIASHRLMLRAGLVRQLAAGLYTWLPLGFRVLRKVANVIREEMDAAGALEVSMPVVQPAELWEESGRWELMGDELQRLRDRNDRDFCLGPTHEEVITALVRDEISSYRQLPLNLYQVQTKYRDERRPRFGVMRSREFIMKDAYSFHLDQASLDETYQAMHEAYGRIFTRLGFDFKAVEADSGNIGGSRSHEFHVLADAGEDEIVFSEQGGYAANLQMASALAPAGKAPAPSQEMTLTATPGLGDVAEVSAFLGIAREQFLKTLIVLGEAPEGQGPEEAPLVALALRGDHHLNEFKAGKLAGLAEPLTFATDEQIQKVLNCRPGSLGPVNLPLRILADRDAAVLSDFACGANQDGHHYRGANWGRDCRFDAIVDIRRVVAGDPSPDGGGKLAIRRGIEVGHIFQLGDKYSAAMNAAALDETGRKTNLLMGCYGIGVGRIVAAVIEQNHDERGIIWPPQIAPFQIAVMPLNAHKCEAVTKVSEELYQQLQQEGFEALLDDRDKNTSAGVKFADMELIGIPHRLVVSQRSLEHGQVEYKSRAGDASQDLKLAEVPAFFKAVLNRP